jgi:hypothetical protein
VWCELEPGWVEPKCVRHGLGPRRVGVVRGCWRFLDCLPWDFEMLQMWIALLGQMDHRRNAPGHPGQKASETGIGCRGSQSFETY